MEKFYKIGLIVAVVFLIICLIGMGILLQFQNAGTKFPIHPNTCPDLWTLTNDKERCSVPKTQINMGSIKPWVADASYSFSQLGGNNICGQYKWATENNINCDGVSNYNSC